MRARLKSFIAKNYTLLENFTSLSFLQFVRIIIPILILPKLISSLGLELYGQVVFAQTIVFFFMTFVNFGFDMSGTKQIATHRHDPQKVSSIIFSITTAKILLFTVSLSVFLLFVAVFPAMREYRILYLFSFLFCLQEIMIPVWLFQGLEKMRFITIADVLSRVIYLILVYLFVGGQPDVLLVPLFRFVGVLFAGITSLYIILIKEKIKIATTSLHKIKYYLLDSIPFFYSKLSVVVNDRTNTLILGGALGMEYVAYYDFVYKIIGVINTIFGTLVRVLYPHIALTRNLRKVRLIFRFNFVMSMLCYVLLCLISKQIIMLTVGEIMLPAQSLFYSLGLTLPLVVVGWSLGDLYLAAFGHSKIYGFSSIYSTLLYIVVVGGLYLFNAVTIDSLIFALIARLIFLDVYRYYYCKKYGLIV